MQTTVSSILKSGWGAFLVVAGVVSIVLDVTSPSIPTGGDHNISVFGGGSFVIGWVMIVILMIIPASIARLSGLAPMNKAFAGLWCFVVLIIWSAIHSIGSEPQQPTRPNLAFIGGLILCWRLLSTKETLKELGSIDVQMPAERDESNTSV